MKNRNLFFLIFVLIHLRVFVGTQTVQAVQPEKFMFGVDYYPEQWPEKLWPEDARRMKECGVNTIRIGEFAWYYWEPEEGRYQFELFDKVIALFGQYGIKTILGTPTAAPPKWLTQAHPEVLVTLSNGIIVNDQGRQHATYTSPVYQEYCTKITEAMAKHYQGNHNVIGWQIDNEFYCHINESYSECDKQAYRGFLKDKYQSIDTLNTRWGNQFWSQWYTNWEQVDLPIPLPAMHNPALMLDHKRFLSHVIVGFTAQQSGIIRKYCPEDFITHNGMFRHIDYFEQAKYLDLFSYDSYPTFLVSPQYPLAASLTTARGFNGKFMMMEQQTGQIGQTYLLRTPAHGEMALWAFQTIAHGTDGLLHFRWRSAHRGIEEYCVGVLGWDNIPGARYDEFKKESADIAAIAPEIAGTKIRSDIAILKDYESEWAYEHQFLTSEVSSSEALTALVRAASELKQNIDIIGLKHDFSKFRLIFVPSLLMIDLELAEKITSFVRNGGIFICAAHTAVKNRDNAMTFGRVPLHLTGLFGIEIAGFQCYQPPSSLQNALVFGKTEKVPAKVLAEQINPATAKTIAQWEGDYFASSPACTENGFVQGKAVYYGSFFDDQSAKLLMKMYVGQLGLKPLLEGIPEEVEVTCRESGDKKFYFILNHTDSSVNITLRNGYFDLLRKRPFPAIYNLKPLEYKVIKK